MENWADSLVNGVKKVLLAGVGAVAVVSEKVEEVVEDLVKKGELTVEQGKQLCEKIKQDIQEKADAAAAAAKEDDEASARDLVNSLDSLTPQERAALRARLEEMDDGGENG
jgi:polyhydroxyalkanoate synthesis regulator phasin